MKKSTDQRFLLIYSINDLSDFFHIKTSTSEYLRPFTLFSSLLSVISYLFKIFIHKNLLV